MLSSSAERPRASSVIAARRRLAAARWLARRRALRPRPLRSAGRRRRIGGRIAGGKGLLELLVELLLCLGGRLARLRLARFFHPSCSGGLRERKPASRVPHALEEGLTHIDQRSGGSEARPEHLGIARQFTISPSVQFCARLKLSNHLSSFFCNSKRTPSAGMTGLVFGYVEPWSAWKPQANSHEAAAGRSANPVN
jgi:hypothetical protein